MQPNCDRGRRLAETNAIIHWSQGRLFTRHSPIHRRNNEISRTHQLIELLLSSIRHPPPVYRVDLEILTSKRRDQSEQHLHFQSKLLRIQRLRHTAWSI